MEDIGVTQQEAYLAMVNNRHDFGTVKIKKAPQIRIDFEFTNMGSEPLIILKTDVSCGCISADFTKEPILPGAKGMIEVQIDTKGQEGSFNKTIFATNDVELIRIVGQIK